MGLKAGEREQALLKIMETLQGLEGSVLVVNDRSGALYSLGGERWNRYSIGKIDGKIIAEGCFDHIVLRIDVSKEVTRQLALFCNSIASAQAKIWLIGGNDEGIKSVVSTLEGIFSGFETIAIKKRFRLVEAKPTANSASLLPLEKTKITILGEEVSWQVSPSSFAKGKLDPGTAFLLDYLKAHPRKRALQLADFASGTGVLTFGLKLLYPEAHIDGIEADAWAMEAAKKNVAGVHWLLSDGWTKMPRDRRYDLIVSNPPVHFGKEIDYSILEGLIRGAKERMHRRGEILMVLQSHVPLFKLFPAIRAEVVEERLGYRIWKVNL